MPRVLSGEGWPRCAARPNQQGAGTGVADRLAHVGAIGQGEHLGVGLDQVGEPVQQRTALGVAHLRPGTLVEGAAGGQHGLVAS
jgi:hypothetical protein